MQPRKQLKFGKDYLPIPYEKDDKHHAFVIRTGKFEGVQFVIGEIKFEENEEETECHANFTYKILEDLDNVYEVTELEEEIGEIVNSVLLVAVNAAMEEEENHNVGESDRDRT